MKTLVFICIPLLALTGCNKESLNPAIRFNDATDCKQVELKNYSGITFDQDCIQYSYSDNVLTIKHINAGYNCCPEGFDVRLQVSGDTLIIRERENSSLCDCNCLFDLDYTVSGVETDVWWIRIDEEYIQTPGLEKLFFKVDLRNEPQGQFCVQRTLYPWRI